MKKRNKIRVKIKRRKRIDGTIWNFYGSYTTKTKAKGIKTKLKTSRFPYKVRIRPRRENGQLRYVVWTKIIKEP